MASESQNRSKLDLSMVLDFRKFIWHTKLLFVGQFRAIWKKRKIRLESVKKKLW